MIKITNKFIQMDDNQNNKKQYNNFKQKCNKNKKNSLNC